MNSFTSFFVASLGLGLVLAADTTAGLEAL
jgi:hypothetical protein